MGNFEHLPETDRTHLPTSKFPFDSCKLQTLIVDWQRDNDSTQRTERANRSCTGSCRSSMLLCCRKWIELESNVSHPYWTPCQRQLWNRLPGIRLSHRQTQGSNAVFDCNWWMNPFASTTNRTMYNYCTFTLHINQVCLFTTESMLWNPEIITATFRLFMKSMIIE